VVNLGTTVSIFVILSPKSKVFWEGVQPNGTASLKAVQEVVAHAEESGKGHSIEESHLYWYYVVEWGKRVFSGRESPGAQTQVIWLSP
jgi:hypothetical protein